MFYQGPGSQSLAENSRLRATRWHVQSLLALDPPEVLRGLGHDVVVELELDPAGVLSVDVNVEVDDRPGAWGQGVSGGGRDSVDNRTGLSINGWHA